MRTEVKARLDVWDFTCGHHAVTDAFGIQPSRIWQAGDKIKNTDRKYESIGWRYDSTLPVSSKLAEHVKGILDQIYIHEKTIRALGKYEAWIVGVIYIYGGDRPDLVIEHSLIKGMSDLQIGLDIDLYNF